MGKLILLVFMKLTYLPLFGNGNGTFQTATASSPGFTKSWSWANNNDFPRMLADVNGDGKADIVGFHETHVFTSLGNGNGTFQTATASSPGFTQKNGGWNNNDDFPRMLADVNGDGKADIVGFGERQVFTSLGNGNGTFQAATASSPAEGGFTKKNGGWNNNNDFPRMLADVNGDGKDDILGFGGTHVFTSFASVAPQGLMATPDKLTQLMNGQLNGRFLDVDKAYGAQCWDLVAYATGNMKSTTTWRRGVNVMANGNVAVGTAIATFLGPNNAYDNPRYVNGERRYIQHTAIFAGYGSENGVSGFYVWDQNWNVNGSRAIKRHFIANNRYGTSDADNYYIIQA